MALVTTELAVDPSDEPLDVQEAMQHLRLTDTAHDEEVMRLVAAARDFCERQTRRTLRVDVTRVLTTDSWPCSGLALDWPPLRSVTSVKYYDTDGAQQTLASSNYRLELSTDGKGRLHWDDDADLPSIDARHDAIAVTFVTGYADNDSIPRTAVQAIKAKLTELWGDATDNELKAAEQCANRLLNTVDMTGYA